MNKILYYDCHSHHLNDTPQETLSIYVAPLGFTIPSSHSNLPFCLGLHPWDRDKVNFEQWCQQNQKTFASKNCWAIGEVGIDRLKNAQEKFPSDYLKYFFNLAKTYEKPIVLHIVKAHQELLDFLNKHSNFQKIPIIIHAYQANLDLTFALKEHNCYFSLGCRELKRKTTSKEYTKCLWERLLLETDDGDNSIQKCYGFAAQFFNKSLQEVADKVQENFRQLFF